MWTPFDCSCYRQHVDLDVPRWRSRFGRWPYLIYRCYVTDPLPFTRYHVVDVVAVTRCWTTLFPLPLFYPDLRFPLIPVGG